MEREINRRDFLSATAGLGAAVAFGCTHTIWAGTARPLRVSKPPPLAQRKLIVILFGGGTRSSESVDDPEHRYVPYLWNEMVPQGTLFTNVRVEHKVVHPNSAGSIMTGHWEWDDVDWTRPVVHPTIFEIFRKARGTPDTATWAFVYASILAKTGESLAKGYGTKYAANIVEPPTIPRKTAEEMERRMQRAAALGSHDAEMEAARACAELARATSRIATTGLRSKQARRFLDDQYATWRGGCGTTSHDAFLTSCAIACMGTFAPDVVAVDFGEIDCAHYGCWSRYVDAIRRTDELTWRLWRATEELDAYRGKTLLLILPDHGRELDQPGHWGFIHHSNFYTDQGADEGCRRVWMLALGPTVKASHQVDRSVPITAVTATGLEYLGLEASPGAERSVWNLLT